MRTGCMKTGGSRPDLRATLSPGPSAAEGLAPTLDAPSQHRAQRQRASPTCTDFARAAICLCDAMAWAEAWRMRTASSSISLITRSSSFSGSWGGGSAAGNRDG